jgi:hypothetical protein
MLNCTEVLEYVKDNLGFPHMHLELSDEEILKIITNTSLKEFSKYFPQKVQVGINLNLSMNKVPGYQNRYYIFDPDELEILNISDVIMSQSADLFFGHPAWGTLSYNEVPSFMLATEMARTAKKWSRWNYNYIFYHPNILQITPIPNDIMCIVEYERMQPPDLRGISNELQYFYKDLCLADTMIRIGRIRKRYGDGNLKTPFGEIPLSAEIFEEGKEMKRELLEKFEKGSLPNVTISFG